MKIDGNELAILQNELDQQGFKDEALKIKLEFLRQVRESGDHCPCKEACRHHGNCFECVTIHRGHRAHLPMCLWDMVNERLAALSHMTEGTLRAPPPPPTPPRPPPFPLPPPPRRCAPPPRRRAAPAAATAAAAANKIPPEICTVPPVSKAHFGEPFLSVFFRINRGKYLYFVKMFPELCSAYCFFCAERL